MEINTDNVQHIFSRLDKAYAQSDDLFNWLAHHGRVNPTFYDLVNAACDAIQKAHDYAIDYYQESIDY